MIFDIMKQRKRSKIVAGSKINYIMPYYSEGQKWIKIAFYSIGFILAVFAFARPRWGVETINADVKGRDMLIVLDTSLSMSTNDVIPTRMETAKREINEILQMETGDRIGLMVFSGESELVCPITYDYAALSFFLDSIYPNMLPKEGTDIGDALQNGIESFDDTEPSNKMILLFTDGENLEGDYYSMLKKLKDSEIKVFTVGVGTKEGELIPMYNEKGEKESALKDSSGNFVKSKLDEKRLIEIAETSGGAYLRTTGNKGEIVSFINSITSIDKKNQGKLKYDQKKERYDIFLIPGLIFLILGFILDQGRLVKFNIDKLGWLFNKNMIALVLIILSLTAVRLNAKTDASHDASIKENKQLLGDPNGGFWGNSYFKKGDYKKSLEKYISATDSVRGNEKGKLYYNIGNSYYKLNDLKKAGDYFEQSVVYLTDDKIKSMAYYNEGLVIFKNQDYKTAKELFKKSILLNSEDDDARYNYMVCSLLEEKSKQNQDENSKDKSQEKNKSQDKQKENRQDQSKKNDSQELTKDETEKLLKALDEKEKKENKENALMNQSDQNGRGKSW
jgi:Ca-activated chloride channel family protein